MTTNDKINSLMRQFSDGAAFNKEGVRLLMQELAEWQAGRQKQITLNMPVRIEPTAFINGVITEYKITDNIGREIFLRLVSPEESTDIVYNIVLKL